MSAGFGPIVPGSAGAQASPDPARLEHFLAEYERDRLSGGALCTAFRAAAAAWPGLPPRFHEVLETLLQPLESSALFSEESCAFSRHDLAATLRPWLVAAVRKAPVPGTGAAAGDPSFPKDPQA